MVRKFIDKIRGKRNATGPIIDTPWGPVTESARRQAAINLKLNPVLREKVRDMMIDRLGSVTAADAEMRRRYPEAFDA